VKAQADQLCYAYDVAHGLAAGTPCTNDDLVQECVDAFPRASICAGDAGCP
jgi:hypothetical protein